jgi:hypothetical protein
VRLDFLALPFASRQKVEKRLANPVKKKAVSEDLRSARK